MTGDVVMPFGRFTGTAVRDLPDHYLVWLRRQAQRGLYAADPYTLAELRVAVEAEYVARKLNEPRRQRPLFAPQVVCIPAELRDLARQVVDRGFRACAVELHPDHGGDVRAMQKLNAAVSVLRQVVTA